MGGRHNSVFKEAEKEDADDIDKSQRSKASAVKLPRSPVKLDDKWKAIFCKPAAKASAKRKR